MKVQQIKQEVTELRHIFRNSMDFLDHKYEETVAKAKFEARAYLLIENRRAEIIHHISQYMGNDKLSSLNLAKVELEIEQIKERAMEELNSFLLEQAEETVWL